MITGIKLKRLILWKIFNDLLRNVNTKSLLKKNPYTSNEDFRFWDGMKSDDIPTIKDCPLHITIYNGYIE